MKTADLVTALMFFQDAADVALAKVDDPEVVQQLRQAQRLAEAALAGQPLPVDSNATAHLGTSLR